MSADLLFLDFDGTPAGLATGTGIFVAVRCSEAVIREAPDVEIVITSTWRDTRDLATLRGFFSNNIARPRHRRHAVLAGLAGARRRDRADVCPAN